MEILNQEGEITSCEIEVDVRGLYAIIWTSWTSTKSFEKIVSCWLNWISRYVDYGYFEEVGGADLRRFHR